MDEPTVGAEVLQYWSGERQGSLYSAAAECIVRSEILKEESGGDTQSVAMFCLSVSCEEIAISLSDSFS